MQPPTGPVPVESLRKVTLRLPAEVVDALWREARAQNRSFTGQVIWALRVYLRGHAEQKESNHAPSPS